MVTLLHGVCAWLALVLPLVGAASIKRPCPAAGSNAVDVLNVSERLSESVRAAFECVA
jgi:hypothetical protein